MYAVRFMYPANPAAQESLTPEERVARDLALAQKNRPRNVDYWFCGNRADQSRPRRPMMACIRD